ncbi:hypothetical protein PAPYR_7208 [Paratrimastix pyriformis]|uniref:Uncharacterized protein n=1 Tax=Paratrimastix pyriformis TaxID=342808 RepID=A0ABQ8UDN3_9EUKA|nr:hypothetical protein PAPYR_7208 [Paratrimastix pyriformis]
MERAPGWLRLCPVCFKILRWFPNYYERNLRHLRKCITSKEPAAGGDAFAARELDEMVLRVAEEAAPLEEPLDREYSAEEVALTLPNTPNPNPDPQLPPPGF